MVRLICTLLLLGRLGGEVAEEHIRSLPLLKWLHPVIDACRGWLGLGFTGSGQWHCKAMEHEAVTEREANESL